MNPYFESEYRESRMMHSCQGVIYVVKQGDTLKKNITISSCECDRYITGKSVCECI